MIYEPAKLNKSESSPEEAMREILVSIHTSDERDRTYHGIEAMEESFYRSQPEALDERLWELFPENVKRVLRSVISRPPYDQNRAQAGEFLRALKARLKTMLVIKLDLAFSPQARVLDKITRWIKENVAEDAIAEIGLDRTIVGGARMVFGGRYLEETLEKLLLREFEENRTIITGLGLRKHAPHGRE